MWMIRFRNHCPTVSVYGRCFRAAVSWKGWESIFRL